MPTDASLPMVCSMRSPDLAVLVLHHAISRTSAEKPAPRAEGKRMKRTWLTVVVPIALAFTLLRVSAATEHACVGQPERASGADDRINAESMGEAVVAGCDSLDGSKQSSLAPFDRPTHYGAVQSFFIAPEPSISTLLGLGLASRAVVTTQVSDVKRLIRRKPP
jgi:hypothetical protein